MCNYSICHIHHPFNATQCSTSTIHTRKRPNIIDRTQIRKMALALRTRAATGPCSLGPFDLVDSVDLTAQVVVVIAVHPLHNINIKINHIYIYFSSSIIPAKRRMDNISIMFIKYYMRITHTPTTIMSKKNKGRGVPVDMSYDDDFSSLGDGSEEHGSGAHASSGSFFSMLTPSKTSSRSRKQAVKDEAARILEEAKAEKAAQAESDRLYKEYMKLHQPRSVTCSLCKSAKPVSDAIALGWKKHPFGFANQAICAACDSATVPFTSPKLVWAKPDHISTRHTKMMKALDHAKTPPNALKSQLVTYSEFEPIVQKRRPNIMRHQLIAEFLTPPEGAMSLTTDEIEKLTKAINSRRGGTRAKSRSRSRSRSKSKSRSR